MSEPAVDYAARANQRKKNRMNGRKSTMSTEERLKRQVIILADRLSLALQIMQSHEGFVAHADLAGQMKFLEDWADELVSTEPEPDHPGKARKFDFYRGQKINTYMKTSVRAMLRRQIHNPPPLTK